MGGQRHAPAALPPAMTRYPLYRRLGGPQCRSGRVRKISPSPVFDPWTVQPVASRYADCDIPETCSSFYTCYVYCITECIGRKMYWFELNVYCRCRLPYLKASSQPKAQRQIADHKISWQNNLCAHETDFCLTEENTKEMPHLQIIFLPTTATLYQHFLL